VHQVLAAEDDRLDLIQHNWTVADAKEEIAQRRRNALPGPSQPSPRQPSAKDLKIEQQARLIAQHERTIAGLRADLRMAGERNMQAVTAGMHDHVCAFRLTRTCSGCGKTEDAEDAEAGQQPELVAELRQQIEKLQADRAKWEGRALRGRERLHELQRQHAAMKHVSGELRQSSG
jgi:hypothetical protein